MSKKIENIYWEKISDCCRCGKPSEYNYLKKIIGFFGVKLVVSRTYCKNCLLEVLREDGVEKTKIEWRKKQ